MKTLAYIAVLLAKLQAAFAFANNAGVAIPVALSEAITKLQSLVNEAEGMTISSIEADVLAAAEKYIAQLAEKELGQVLADKAIADCQALVAGKAAFDASFSQPASVVIQPVPQPELVDNVESVIPKPE